MENTVRKPPASFQVPLIVRLCVTAVTAFITSALMSFLGLALNYGFRPDFFYRWLKVFALGYVVLVPVLLLILPPIQRLIVAAFARSGYRPTK